MNLQTILGSIPIGDVKMADAHAHAWIDPPKGVAPKHRLELKNARLIEAELKDFRSGGGTTLIDCQPGGCGRDGHMLAKLSESTGLHITATTGFHLQHYYPYGYWLWSASEHEAADFFVNELTIGLHENGDALATTIKVGYTGKIEEQTRVLMEAAAEASRQTGAAILFHTEQGQNVEALPTFFEDRGVSANRLYMCHVDKRPDIGLHRELAQAGALLGYDTFVRTKYKPGQNVWPLLVEMVRAGYDGNIAIGLDLALSSMWRHYGGGPGMITLPEEILNRLHSEELSVSIIEKLVGQNVARVLVRETGKE